MKEFEKEITSLNRYYNNQLNYIAKDNKQYGVSGILTYDKWCSEWFNFETIKINGLEDNKHLLEKFNFIPNINSIHLYVKLQEGHSFDFHRDDCDVYLYVLKGHKEVWVEGKTTHLKENEGVYIPKGALHKVISTKDTWGLSVGYSNV